MDTSPETSYEFPVRSSRAPLTRRIGANLLDSGLALLAVYLATMPIGFAYSAGFGDFYLPVCQSIIIGWVVLKDAWWPGQSLGKRVARIRINGAQSGKTASRLRCVWRQAIFVLALVIINLPAYLWVLPSAQLLKQGVLSAVLSAGGPIRLLPLLFTARSHVANQITVAHLVSIGFFFGELGMAYGRRDGRRIVDLVAGTQVVDDRQPHPS